MLHGAQDPTSKLHFMTEYIVSFEI